MKQAVAKRDIAPRTKPESVGLSSARLGEIGKVLDADIASGQMPGAVLMFVRKGKLAYFETFGWRDKAAGVRMTADTIFNIASMTKPVIALAALQLLEQGKLRIDDTVAKYFPKFGGMKVAVLDATGEKILDRVPAARPITLVDLMRHTSGLPYGSRGTTAVHKLYPDGSHTAAAVMSGAEFLDKLSTAPLLHQPGAVWDYGFGLDVLGLVIEQISGQKLADYLRANIFEPLGMRDTSFLIPAGKVARYAKNLPNDPLTGRPQSLPDLTTPLRFDCGGGGLASTADDYMRFALMLLNHGTFRKTRILGRKTVEYMLSNQLGPEVRNLIAAADPTRVGYGFGLGLAVRTTPGLVPMLGSVGEFNWPGMSGTNWWADPREQLAVVYMTHTPGVLRWHYRQVINALVYQAISD